MYLLDDVSMWLLFWSTHLSKERLERPFYIINEAKGKRGYSWESLERKEKGFRIYMQQISSKKKLHVFLSQRKRVESGSPICSMLTFSSELSFLMWKTRYAFYHFLLYHSVFSSYWANKSYMAQMSAQMEDKILWTIEILLGLGETSTRTGPLVDSYLILVGVWISSLNSCENGLRYISGILPSGIRNTHEGSFSCTLCQNLNSL